jgi:ribonuclease III
MSDPFALYRQALTHRSWAAENGGQWYERLEFLGDAVLQLTISELLYARFPDDDPGTLTRKRSQLVQNEALAEIAQELDLISIARLGKGEALSQPEDRMKLQADLVEALLGAILLDQGVEVAREVVRTRWAARIRSASAEAVNPKTALQELLQKRLNQEPTYQDLAQEGPPHRRRFQVGVYLGDEKLAQGEGSSKKAAQQDAARRALVTLRADRARMG